ncbi:MAG: Mycothiol acetyltransferase [Candidatus Izimaplasma bacterium HR2]|nr:MAG: Mycothiol acetyltransferase [Candidatus Izimaplasma bacterium HR2]
MGREVVIRKATITDAEGKGYVHYHSWNETYTGLIDQEYLDSRSLKKCIESAKNYPQNTYVAIVDNKVIGFSCYLKARDEDLKDAGEINAIYILKDYYGLGIGKRLMDVCYNELSEYSMISLWVLKSNKHAIDFYEHLGFAKDGKEKEIKISEKTKLNEIRMVLDKFR